jgi:hypothetical protein
MLFYGRWRAGLAGVMAYRGGGRGSLASDGDVRTAVAGQRSALCAAVDLEGVARRGPAKPA